MNKGLELRMYGLVNYQLTGIQQGIQFGHAVVEYSQIFKNDKKYNNWANHWKTFIILNGGTTNTNIIKLGTLNKHLETLKSNDVDLACFMEPDLGDQLTAVCFIVDERVFNREKYPDFEEWVCAEMEDISYFKGSSNFYSIIKDLKGSEKYNKWIQFIGGEKNLFLREFLRNFRLA